MDPAALRAGLAANLQTIAAPFHAYETAPNSPEPPCAWMWADDPFIERDSMHMGIICCNYKIVVCVQAGDNEAGLNQLDSYLMTSGEKSVWRAIESDKRAPQGALNGAADDVSVVEVKRFDGNYIIGGNGYFAAEFSVQALCRG